MAGRFATPALLALLGLGAAILYAPMLAAPLEIRDYSELLLVFPGSRDVWDTYAAITRYFAGHGRFLPATHGFIALNWTLFGTDTVGWQLLRGVLMAACAIAAFALLRRFGTTRFAAAAGATLFVLAPGASAAWIRLAGEPIATLALLAAAILATLYRQTVRWRAAGIAIALLSAVAIFAKETSIAAVPFLIALALFAPVSGKEPGADQTARRRWLLAVSAIIVLTALAPIAAVALEARATADSYVAMYGDGRAGLTTFVRRALWMALPFPPFTAPTRLRLFALPPNLIFFGLLAIGGLLSSTSRLALRTWLIAVAVAIALPAAGAAAYQPWPRFESLYTLPFIFGSALALAVSLSVIERLRPRAAPVAYAAYLIPVFYMTLLARETVERTVATRSVNASIVTAIATRRGADTILIGDPSPPRQSWQGHAATLGRYARAVGGAPAIVLDVKCERIHSAGVSPTGGAVLVSYSNLCGPIPRPSRVMAHRFAYLNWRSMSIERDSVRADVFLPEQAGRGSR